MGFWKTLGYIGAGVGAVALIPATGGGSLAAAIGAFGTTTAAGAAIGASAGATAAAISGNSKSKEAAKRQAYNQGKEEGKKAGQAIAAKKYEKKIFDLTQKSNELVERFERYYQDQESFAEKLVAMHAVGLAIANADGNICAEEQEEIDAFVSGCSGGHLPVRIKKKIAQLSKKPPSMERALELASEAQLPKRDIKDIIDVVAHADGEVTPEETAFIKQWRQMSKQYEFA